VKKFIIKIQLLMLICLGFVYPCTNCSIPEADAGVGFTVINGGAGVLDGSNSYDPDNFELELTYLWYSVDNMISYCSAEGDDECSGTRNYCDGYEELYANEDECLSNGYEWLEDSFVDYQMCWAAGYVWAHTD
jgi:hypothetical protein